MASKISSLPIIVTFANSQSLHNPNVSLVGDET